MAEICQEVKTQLSYGEGGGIQAACHGTHILFSQNHLCNLVEGLSNLFSLCGVVLLGKEKVVDTLQTSNLMQTSNAHQSDPIWTMVYASLCINERTIYIEFNTTSSTVSTCP